MAVGDEANDGSGGDAAAARDAKIAALTAQVEALTKQVELLTEQLNRNSKSSHLPPSSDGPGSSLRGGKAERNKRKAERKRGAQKGHRGSHRELLPVERVDTVVDLFPDVCLSCARPLPPTVDVARRPRRRDGPRATYADVAAVFVLARLQER